MRKIKNKEDKLRKYNIKFNGISRQNGKTSLIIRKFKEKKLGNGCKILILGYKDSDIKNIAKVLKFINGGKLIEE